MNSKKIFIGMAMCSLLFTVACQKEELTADESGESKRTTLFASFESPTQTRTELGELVDGRTPVLWSEGDIIAAIGANDATVNFFLAAGEGTSNASFYGLLDPPFAMAVDTVVAAVYPPCMAGRPVVAATPIDVPMEQNYVVDNISMESNIAVAKADGDKLAFKNVCGILNVRLTGTATITKIIISSEDALSGRGYIDRTTDNPVLTMATDSTGIKEVMLNCGDGVVLTEEPTNFYIVVPPTTAKSFTMEIESTEGSMIYTTSENDKNVFTKAKILTLPNLAYANDYSYVKHLVKEATATSEHPGHEIGKSFDGIFDGATHYHSNWAGGDLPISLCYTLEGEGVDLDYIHYYTRNGNGNFGEVDIYLSTSANDDDGYGKIFMTYDFKQVSTSTKVLFDKKQTGIKHVKFVVRTGKEGFASCAEMEFMELRKN